MKYRVLIGCNYPGADGVPVRREPGDVVDDVTPEVAAAYDGIGVLTTDVELAEPIGDGSVFDAPAFVAYHAADGKVHHTNPGCPVGNNIEPATRLLGTGDLKKCRDCARLERAEKE